MRRRYHYCKISLVSRKEGALPDFGRSNRVVIPAFDLDLERQRKGDGSLSNDVSPAIVTAWCSFSCPSLEFPECSDEPLEFCGFEVVDPLNDRAVLELTHVVIFDKHYQVSI